MIPPAIATLALIATFWPPTVTHLRPRIATKIAAKPTTIEAIMRPRQTCNTSKNEEKKSVLIVLKAPILT